MPATVRSAIAAAAIALAALGWVAPAAAAEGPCADVPYVGVCEPYGDEPTGPSKQSTADVAFPASDTSSQPVS